MSTTDARPVEAYQPATYAPALLRHHAMEVAAEIAHALLTASSPLDVYRLALARVTPIVGADFACVFLRDPADPSLLKLEAAHAFPQAAARHLSQFRIREGHGPTGRAVADRAAVEVADLFAEPALRDWWAPARELGFASLISLPLIPDSGTAGGGLVRGEPSSAEPAGAVTFYFRAPHDITTHQRHLLLLTADQLSAAIARARLLDELRTANERLRQNNRMLERRVNEANAARRLEDEFLANISHEFRTPLTSVVGYTYLMAEGQMGPVTDRQRGALAKIDGAANALLRVLCDLIDLAQLRLGRIGIDASHDDAIRLARCAADAAGPPPAGVAFELATDVRALPLETDGDKVIRILGALLSNAYKFTDRGRVSLRVTTKASAAGPRVEWAVSDTGIGIAPAEMAAIFDDFRQGDGSTTRAYGGAGLGLAISRGFAHLLGGELTAESQPGRGSTFRLHVPAAVE